MRVPPARILIVRLGAIGDCLRVLPSVVRLRREAPDATIGWVVSDLAAPVLQGHPAISRFHVVQRRALKSGLASAWSELRRAGAELRAARYDVAIDFHTRLRSGYLARASGAPLRIGLDRASGSEANFLFTNCHVSLPDVWENRVTRFWRLLAPLGIGGEPAPGDVRSALWIAPAALAEASAIWEQADRPAVAVFAGTSSHRSHDRWPLEKWRAVLADLTRARVSSMVVWGPGELEAAAELAVAGGALSRVAPPTSLPVMMALLGQFRLYIGTNTAALHMAWMQGVPCVVLAGGRPWRTDRPLPPAASVMLSAGGVEPARKLRGEARRRAIEGIEPGEVVSAARSLLDAAPVAY
jgi:ADP-heptose:LPS heptosyltransferase